MNILGIESSADETAAAIVANGTTIVSAAVASSQAVHRKYGGIVPELAARKQIESIIPVLTETFSNASASSNSTVGASQLLRTVRIDAIATTVGPGLVGSLLIGVETAKTLASIWNKPVIPVNHVHAHIYANFVHEVKSLPAQAGQKLKVKNNTTIPQHNHIAFPAIALVASGGHTELFLMQDAKTFQWLGGTIDDAAGEAFDKTARLLGLANGGGAALAAKAALFPSKATELKIKLPRPLLDKKNLHFSFSGLKTATLRAWERHKTHSEKHVQAFAYEIQEAITDVLVSKTIAAAQQHQARSILLSGGVAANQRLRQKFLLNSSSFGVHAPNTELCTDNAAMVAAYAYYHYTPQPAYRIAAQPGLGVET